VNCGILGVKPDGSFTHFDGAHIYSVKAVPPQEAIGKFWDPYESEMVISNIVLKRLCIAAIPSLDQHQFVEHRDIDPDRKSDCGPLWPLRVTNTLAFNYRDIGKLVALETVCLSKTAVSDLEKEVSLLPGP
jgi:N-acetyl-anhydromuramyl-L-alanine amidase AmpD